MSNVIRLLKREWYRVSRHFWVAEIPRIKFNQCEMNCTGRSQQNKVFERSFFFLEQLSNSSISRTYHSHIASVLCARGTVSVIESVRHVNAPIGKVSNAPLNHKFNIESVHAVSASEVLGYNWMRSASFRNSMKFTANINNCLRRH